MALKKVPMYIKNVAKSIKYSGIDYLNNTMPETMDFVSTNSEVLKAVTNDLRNYKNIYKQAKTIWSSSSIKGTLNEGLSNAMKDLSTGNFYNKDRENAQMFKESGWEDVLGGFEEEINSAIRDFNSANTLNAQNNTTKSVMQNTEATVGVMSTVGKIVSETTANSAEYIVQSNNNIATKNMVNTYKMMGNVTTLLSDISTNIRSINDYTNKIGDFFNNASKVNTELNNKIDQLLALQKEVAEMERNKYKEYNESKNNNYVEPLDNANFTRGAFNIKGYFETVIKRAKQQYENSTLGSMQSMMQGVDPLKLIATNPLKFISEAGFNKLISKELRKSMESLDETMSGFFNSALLKGSTFLRKKADETGSDIFNMIADVFGIKKSDPGKMRTDLYVKESIPWNGMADRALTEVLPTYARKILAAITGQEEMIYDYKSGKFNKITDVKKALEQAEDNSYSGVSGMEREISETIKNAFTMSNSLQETFDKDLKEFFKTIVDKQVFYNPNKMTYDDLKNMGLYFRNGEDSFNLINAAFKSMDRQKWNKFNTDVINAGETRRNEINNLNKTGAQSGYTGVRNGFEMSTNSDGKNLLSQGFGLNRVDKYKKSVFDYMRDIRRILLEGIRVFPVNGIVSDSIQIEGGSIENRINSYKDNEPEHHTTSIRVSDYNVSDEELQKRAQKSNGKVLDNLYNLGLSNRGMADYMKRIRDERRGAQEEEEQNQQPVQNGIVNKSKSVIRNIYDTGKELASAPGKILKNILDSVNDNLLFFLYGSRDGKEKESIFDSIMKRVNIITEKITNTVNDHVIKPLNNVLFNKENGIITKFNNKVSGIMEKVSNKLFDNNDGILTNLKNKTTELFYGNDDHHGIGYYVKGAAQDTFNGFMNVVSGKEYTSILTGKKHEARQETMLSIFKDGFDSIKDAGRKMFSKLSNSSSGLSLKETISNRINSMTAKASNVLFGTTEESMKPSEFFSRHISPRLPRSMMGAMAGLGLSLFTPLGLVGGIAVGGATGFLSYFDKFKTVLFGEEGSEKRMKADNFFSSINNALPRMGVGAISGAALSLFTPLGLVGGTMLGGVMGYLSTSDKFKEFLFGNGVDKKGIIKREWYDKFKEKLPGGAIGAGMGAIGSLFLPGGPVGGAIMGLTLGIAGQSNMIKTYLFGDEDPETGKRQGGLFGKFRLFLQTEIMMPLKTFAKEVGSKGLYFIRKDLINPILDSLAPIKKEMFLIKDRVFEKIGEIKDSIVNKAEDLILRPINKAVTVNIIDPMKNFFKKIFGGIGNALKNILKAPSSMINGYAMNLMEKHKKMGVADYLDDWQKKKNERDMKTNKKYQEAQQEVMFEKYRNEMVNKLVRKGKYDINDPNTKRAMDWMNMNGYKYTENISNKMDENTSILDRLKNLFTEFKSRWDIRNNFKPSGDNTNTSKEEKQKQRILNNQTRNNNKNNNDYEPIIMPGDISGSNLSREERQKQRILNNQNRNNNKNNNSYGTIIMPGDISGSNQPNFVLVNNPSNNNQNRNNNKNNRRNTQPNFIMMDNNQAQNNYNTNTDRNTNTYSNPFNDLNSIKKDTSTIAESVDGQVNGVGYHTELISNILVDLFGLPSVLPSGVKKFSHKIKGLFDIFKGPKQFLGKITNMITAPFKSAFNLIKGIPAQVAKTTGSIIKITAGAIKSVASGVLGIIPQILEGINIIGKTVGNVMISAFKTLPSIVKTLGVAVQETTKVIGRGLVEGVKLLGTGLKEATKFTGEFAVGLAKTAKTVIPAFAEGLIETTKIIGKGVLGAIKGTFNLGKKMVSGISGKRKNRNIVEQVMNIERINKIGVIESVKMVEKIGDVRLFETLGQMTTAIYSLRTGTDDMPVKFGTISNNDEKNEDHEKRSKSKDDQVKGKVISITDRINKQKSKEKREKNTNVGKEDNVLSMPALGTVIDENMTSNTGNKQVDAFKNKEIGQVTTKINKIRNALSLASDKANISTGKIISRVFKKGGVLSTIATLTMTLLPKALSFFKNLKSKVLSIGKKLLDYFLQKFHINLPKFGGGGAGANSLNNFGKPTAEKVVTNAGEKTGVKVLEKGTVKGLEQAADTTGKKAGIKLLEKGTVKGLKHVTATTGEKTGVKLLGNSVVKGAETGGERLLLNGATETVEKGTFKAAEKYGASNIIKGASFTVMDEGGKQIAKSGFKESVQRFGQKVAGSVVGDNGIISKVLNSAPVKKLAGAKIAPVLKNLAEFITSRMKNAGKAIFGKIAAKWGAIIGTGAVSGGVIPALWYGGKILYGVTETQKIFQLSESDKPSALMRTIAGFSSFISDALTFGIIPTQVIAQFLGSLLLSDEEAQHMKSSQEQLKNEYNQYVTDSGNTDMTFDEYNDKVNGSVFTKAGIGIKNFAKNTLNWGKEKTKNALDWGKEKAKQFGNHVMNKTAFSAFNDDAVRNTFGLDDNVDIELKDRFSQGFGTFISNITGGALDQTRVSKAAQGVLITAEEKWNKLGESVKNFVMNDTAASAFNDDAVRSTFGMDEDAEIEKKDRFSQGFGSFISNISGGLLDKTKVAKATQGTLIKAEDLWGKLQNKVGEYGDKVEEMGHKLNTNLGSMLGCVDEDGNPLTATEGLGQAWDGIKEKVSKVWEGAKGLWSDLGTTFDKFKDYVKDGVVDFDKDLGKMFGFKNDNGESMSLTQKVKQKITDVTNSFTNPFVNKSNEYNAKRNAAAEGGSGFEEGGMGVPYYGQNQGPWANKDFGYNKTIGEAGCGPTAAAMMISSVTGKKITPEQTAKDALNGGYRLKGNGTKWDYLNSAGNKYGVTTTQTNNMDSVKNALRNNHPVVLNGKGGGPYTTGGHYVTATGMTKDGKIMINDPLSKSRSGAYDPKVLEGSTRKAWISNQQAKGGSGNEGTLTKGQLVVNSARKLIGKPYRYGQISYSKIYLIAGSI